MAARELLTEHHWNFSTAGSLSLGPKNRIKECVGNSRQVANHCDLLRRWTAGKAGGCVPRPVRSRTSGDPMKAQTKFQVLEEIGEEAVIQRCPCLRCKRSHTLRRLPRNFRAADVICDFCGFTAQVKGTQVPPHGNVSRFLPGASWPVQRERIESHIFLPLFIVAVNGKKAIKIVYVPPDLQTAALFKPRNPLRKLLRGLAGRGFSTTFQCYPRASR